MRAQFILGRLGLTWDDLKEKEILDLGAHTAELARAARQHGVRVTSLDRNPPGALPKSTRERYIVAEANLLPFADNTFDISISHAGGIDIHPNNPESLHALDEAIRVTKDEVRFDTFAMDSDADASQHVTYQFVKSKYPHAELRESPTQITSLEFQNKRSMYIRVAKE